MKTPEERLKLLEEIFEDFVIAVENAKMEAMARYQIDVLGPVPPHDLACRPPLKLPRIKREDERTIKVTPELVNALVFVLKSEFEYLLTEVTVLDVEYRMIAESVVAALCDESIK